jgi:hypothetical protein
MFYGLCGHLPAQIPDQARGDLCEKVCREVLKALYACWHEICRAKPRSGYIRLRRFLIISVHGTLVTHRYGFITSSILLVWELEIRFMCYFFMTRRLICSFIPHPVLQSTGYKWIGNLICMRIISAH